MAIRVYRNEAANAVNFEGASVEAFYNACLRASVNPDDSNKIDIINDYRGDLANPFYEFQGVPYTLFVDADGNPFSTAQEAIDYIHAACNVIGVGSVGSDLNGEVVNFRHDQTSTSVILSTGQAFGVNTIKAVPAADGTIHIHAIGEGVPSGDADAADHVHLQGIEVGNVQVDGVTVSGGLNDIANALNELFTVGAFEAVVIRDPFSTMVADVTGTATTTSIIGNGLDPAGDDVYGSSAAGALNGFKTTETIDQAGEYFTFDIRTEGQIGFGLIHSQTSYDDGKYQGSATYADPTTFGTSNSAHYGFQFSHWFHPTPNGSWTNYGASTGFVRGSGWSSWESQDEWLAGDPVKVKVGIDENGFIAISTLQDDDATWILHARTSYPVPDGAEFHLGIKTGDTTVRVYTTPKVHLLEPAAPTMHFRYIESPDGTFIYPLFSSAEEAEYYDQNHDGTTGSGTYTQAIYPDDPTSTPWYVPDTGVTTDGTAAPTSGTFQGNAIQWTEVTSLTDADLVPAAFSDTTISVDELSAVNIQLTPADASWTTSVSGQPSGLSISATGYLQGTAPEVTSDYSANPSDDYTITVTRTNTYGSSTGTLTLTVVNLTAPVTALSGFTHVSGTTALVDSDTLDDGSAVTFDNTIEDGKRFIFKKAWVEANVLPTVVVEGTGTNSNPGTGARTYVGLLDASGDLTDGVTDADFDGFFCWEYQTSTSHRSRVSNGTTVSNMGVGSTTDAFFDYAIEIDGTDVHFIACNVNDIMNQPSVNNGGNFSRVLTISGWTGAIPATIYMGTNGVQADISETDIEEIDIPLPDNWIVVTEVPTNIPEFDGSGTMPTLNAGYTYRFVMSDASLDAADNLTFKLTSDGTSYTTGITSSGTFGTAGAYIEFVVPSDVPPLTYTWTHSGGSTDGTVTISGSTYVTPVTGITQEGPVANQTGSNLFDAGDHGWISVDEQLSAGERLVLDGAFLSDLVGAMPDNSDMRIGLKDTAWTDAYSSLGFEGRIFFEIIRYGASDVRVKIGGVFGNTSTIFTTVAAMAGWGMFIDLTSSGNNIRLGFTYSGDGSSDDEEATAYADWGTSRKLQTGDQGYGLTAVDVMLMGSGNLAGNAAGMDTADVDWTGLSEISVPTPAPTLTTPWTKALDFSGGSERTQQVTNDSNRCPLRMSGVNNNAAAPATAGNTSNDTNARPWATAIVFKAHTYNDNQHVWNLGEGSGTTDDNIYLRRDANRDLWFGWGRSGELNECYVGSIAGDINGWWGVYIASNGTRLGSGHSAADIAAAFDIRMVNLQTGATGSNLSTATNWTSGSFGARMNRQFTGYMTIGGRGANRSFRGKVAAMVVTTLRRNVAMPTDAEISMMVRDPQQWMTDYKVGNDFRLPWQGTDAGFNWAKNDGSSSYATQVWLMGDGANDAYAQIRNNVWPATQNYTPMNMISMVSSDIENVTINGLS